MVEAQEVQEPTHYPKRRKVLIVVISIIIVVLLVALSYWYIFYSRGLTGGSNYPHIITDKTAMDAVTLWTIIQVFDGPILKDDVYVQVKNATGDYIIMMEPLLAASGTHGFNYTPASTSDYLMLGDTFSLNKAMYSQGSTITLVQTESATGKYAGMTV